MNGIMKSIHNRKSVRAFEEKEIAPKEKALILEAALQAPTAGNMTLYTILDITDRSLKETLAVTCDNQPFIAKAPLVLVFCADYNRWYQLFKRHCDEVRLPDCGDFQLACADAIIAAQNCVVAAESLGIGSCYIGDITENFERHKELLGLPSHVCPVCMLVFGYPTKQQTERQKPPRFKVEDIVFENTYDNEKTTQMDRMIMEREGKEDEQEFHTWVEKFCARKYNSEFSVEMSRSVREMLRSFCEGE
ncbi:MAG: nitroreductase family protein [Ruminococcus sp.]|nr:nitroreductase family protein [Ruminococcus sp.]